jgi:hypothetical protein
MSTLIVLALVFTLAVVALVVFVAVVAGIHSEPRYQLPTKAQGPLAAMVRRLLGVYVGKPADTDADDSREECLTGNSTDWWDKGGWDR